MLKQKRIETAIKPNGEKVQRNAVILVDWNGTCIEEMWGGSGTWIEGAPEALKELVDAGYTVRIHSLVHHSKDFDLTTSNERLIERAKAIKETREQLDESGLHEVEIEMTDKIPAVWVIDDKAIGFENNWDEIKDKILEK